MTENTERLLLIPAQDAAEARPAGLLRDLLVAVLAGILLLGLAECGLRLAGVKFEGSFYRRDRELGYVLRPNAEGWNIAENENYFQINSDGLADRDHTLQRPPGVIRIAMVGDSVTEAKQIPREQAYWAVMERRLNSRLALRGQRVEVINFGVAGYSLAQDALVIQQRIWKYDPQIIILAGTIESFTLRGTRKLTPSRASEFVPFYVLKDGKLEPDAQTVQERREFRYDPEVHKIEGDALNASRLVGLWKEGAGKAVDEIKRKLGMKVIPKTVFENPHYNESDAFLGPARPELAEAWDVNEALILRARDLAAAHHAEFWLFTLDMPPQVDPDPAKRAEFQQKLGLTDPFLTDHLFAQFAEKEGIRHGTLAPEMLKIAEKKNLVVHGFPKIPRNTGHWNQLGHRIAGELVAQQLLDDSPLLRGKSR